MIASPTFWGRMPSTVLIVCGLMVFVHARVGLAQEGDDGLVPAVEVGRGVFRNGCQICHASELVEQQRLTSKQWSAEIEKMVGWGAPIADDERAALLAYLSSAYSEQRPPARLERVAGDSALALVEKPGWDAVAGESRRGAEVYRRQCATCHGADGLGGDVGSLLLDRRSLASRVEFLELMRGGRGKMPAFAPSVMGDESIDDVLAALRSRSIERRMRDP
jgi:ubiquinol-cytochrome c reductase cytochrome c subunit